MVVTIKKVKEVILDKNAELDHYVKLGLWEQASIIRKESSMILERIDDSYYRYIRVSWLTLTKDAWYVYYVFF